MCRKVSVTEWKTLNLSSIKIVQYTIHYRRRREWILRFEERFLVDFGMVPEGSLRRARHFYLSPNVISEAKYRIANTVVLCACVRRSTKNPRSIYLLLPRVATTVLHLHALIRAASIRYDAIWYIRYT